MSTTAQQPQGAVAQKETQAVATKHPFQVFLEKYMGAIAMALPKHLKPERMMRLAVTAYSTTPALRDCTPMSIVAAIVRASELGLEVGALGHGYLVPFYNNKTKKKEAQFIPGYRGLLDLARRSGQITSIQSHVVHARDKFIFQFGLEDKIEHVPFMGSDRGDRVAVWAKAQFKDGGYAFDVMGKEDVEFIKNKSKSRNAKGELTGPWVTDEDEMWRKTMLRRLFKVLPASVEFADAVHYDTNVEMGTVIEMDEFTALPAADPKDEEQFYEAQAGTIKEPQRAPADSQTDKPSAKHPADKNVVYLNKSEIGMVVAFAKKASMDDENLLQWLFAEFQVDGGPGHIPQDQLDKVCNALVAKKNSETKVQEKA